jgi:hypothetical protein
LLASGEQQIPHTVREDANGFGITVVRAFGQPLKPCLLKILEFALFTTTFPIQRRNLIFIAIPKPGAPER